MESPDFNLLSPDDAAQVAAELNAKQLEGVVAFFNPEQLQRTIQHLVAENDANWRGKIRSILRGLNQRHQLEAMGRSLSPQQMVELLEQCTDDALLREKLQFILVGLPQNVFESILHLADDPQLRVLKDLGTTESIQHHLTLLLHELARLADGYVTDLDELESQIDQYDVKAVRQRDIDSFVQQIEDATVFFNEGLHTIDTALGLAWNTNREDLIDRLTQLKENWLRYLQFGVGRAGTASKPATALYAKLEHRLESIYDAETLEDDDPAIEALAALSLWVLQDYWEVGLIPGIEDLQQLNLDPSKHDEKERALHRERLTLGVQDNLAAVGLMTVGDLKKERLYSRNMLIRFIQKHHNLLSPARPV
ncbi:MAG: hypothetical protein Q8K75_01600 [Chlamydiales bacterium]|nr:hypothetical protein [Chlamydiales bacterium]